jgi:hypothetical protein
MTDKLPRTLLEKALDLGGVEVARGLDFAPKASVQLTAINLHKRGLNVFPIPRGYKEPYLLRPLFFARLHRCGRECRIQHAPSFESIFEYQNIAVMMGRTSENLFAIDCDTQADFRGMGAELDRRGLSYWATKSAKGGHYFMRLAEGEAANNATLVGWKNVQIWGTRHFTVLPPSIHPSGVLYEWHTQDPYRLPIEEKPPLVSIQALDWLGVERATSGKKWEAPELLGLPAWTVNLSRNNRRILASAINGAITEGQRNFELTKPAYDIASLIDAGELNYQDGINLLEEAAEGVDYPLKDIRSTLRSAMNKNGLESARKGGKTQIAEWQKALEFARDYDWQGRSRHTDKAVFLACCERARLDVGAGSFRASQRELARLSNKTRKTVSKALHRLLQDDLLALARTDNSGANRFSFGGVTRKYPTNPTCSYSGVATSHQKTVKLPQTPAEKDVFGRLGAVSWAVYNYLLDNFAFSYKEIAEATKLNRQSVQRVLSRGKNTGLLIAHGLVIYNPAENSYKAELVSNEKLERISANLYYYAGGDYKSVLGKSEKRERGYTAERELRINSLFAGRMARDKRNYLNQSEAKT